METAQTGITVTAEAASHVKELIEENGGTHTHLRLWVAGGGCSGLSYGLALDDNIEEDDEQFQTNDISVLVDAMSLRYLQGATIEYDTEKLGGAFKINNPNAKSGCGCGQSFSAEDEEGGSGKCGGCSGS